MSMAQMARLILQSAGMRHWMIPLPWWIANRLAVLKSWIGGRRVTAEQAWRAFCTMPPPILAIRCAIWGIILAVRSKMGENLSFRSQIFLFS
jgi:hypothetical protein